MADKTDLIEALHDYDFDLRHREIYLVGEPEAIKEDNDAEPGVEFMMANKFIKNLRFLTARSKDPVLIHMKTCGGYWEEGMAIHDAIRACPAHVTILSYTHARSMSSIILQAADYRVLMPNSYLMFHHGSWGGEATWQEIKTWIKWDERANRTMLDIYATRIKERGVHSHKSLASIKTMLRREMEKKIDVFLPAERAVEWGLADAVFDGDWSRLK
jgi:ATP-dependent protease ClpP protease subunit